jgi:hypothetical protein
MPLVKINASTDEECKLLLTDAITGHVGVIGSFVILNNTP